jgi:anaerobic magnesium-protoporphyrin IX monomethyl ester cyclase
MTKNNRKIMLLTPPYFRLYKSTYSNDLYPLALGYLAGAILKKTTWEVMTYNADFSPNSEHRKSKYLAGEGFNEYQKNLKNMEGEVWKEIESTIEDFNPSVIGLSCMTQNCTGAHNIAKIVKQINKNTLVVMGGPHATILPSEVLKDCNIDLCVIGEGEETIVKLLEAIDDNKTFKAVKGIVFREGSKIVENPPRELIRELDSLPFPHKSAPLTLHNYDKYPAAAFGSVFAIRGCPFDCIFCGSRYIWGRMPRYRSPANIVEEIQSLKDVGVTSIHFTDDSFGIKESHITELCKEIKSRSLGIEWSCTMHAKTVKESILSVMKDAGCCVIFIGVESGNNEILKKIRKKNTIEDCYRAAKLIKKFDIKLSAYFMVGFPWETEETLMDTWNAMKNLRSIPVYSIFTPYKGTEVFEECKQMGLIDDNFDFSLYNHQSPLNCFCNIPRERFREICRKFEMKVDRDVFYARIKNVASLRTLKKIGKIGLRQSIIKGMNLVKDCRRCLGQD